MIFILFLLLAYLLGSIPFGLAIGYAVKGVDIRKSGSGNIGATNVFRVVGKKWGILVFFLDALKGFTAVQLPGFVSQTAVSPALSTLLAVTAIVGHSFPIWLGFKGGKGIATSLGVFLALAPLPTLITFGLWGVVFASSRILSLASLVAAALFPVVLILTYRDHPLFDWIFPVSFLLGTFIFYTHRANIARLRRGEEKRLF